MTDKERLDWMIFYSARVCHASDAEFCWVEWIGHNFEMKTPYFGSSRQAIDAAIEIQENDIEL